MIKKRYLIALVLIVVCGVAFVSCSSTGQGSGVNWQKKYPQLTNNVGYSRLIESVPAYQAKTASEQDLIGKVTNQFGIRDDVLKLILTSIPESDTGSTIAAIKMAQYNQAEIGLTNDMEINSIENKASAAVSCTSDQMIFQNSKFFDSYNQLLRDTPARQAEQDRIEHLLNNHVISNDYGIQSYDKKEQCDHLLSGK